MKSDARFRTFENNGGLFLCYRVFERGDFSRAPEMHKTLSDAINIQQPYNFERVLFRAISGLISKGSVLSLNEFKSSSG